VGVAIEEGRRYIGIELDLHWFDYSCRRIEQATKQPNMFIDTPAKPVQEKLI